MNTITDARSMREADFAACELVYPDRVGQTHVIMHQPRHRWNYYSAQRKSEALLLKCWDSEAGACRPTRPGVAISKSTGESPQGLPRARLTHEASVRGP